MEESTLAVEGRLQRWRRESRERGVPWKGILSLLAVYIIWGSTYLAIRIAVREGAGFPPFSMSASRVLVAGLILLAWAALSHRRLKITREEMIVLAVTGTLLWAGGNGLVSAAEQRSDSGYAALIIGATPIWAAIIQSGFNRSLPSWGLVLSLSVGFGGIVLLSIPILIQGGSADYLSLLLLLAAGLSWALGSVIVGRDKMDLSTRSTAAYQHFFGVVGLVLLALLFQEERPAPTPQAIGAWIYLIIFGSVIGFTSFVNALRLLPTNIVMTYAFVNPVIAVFLGWVILGESVTLWTIVGAGLVLLGVAGVFRDRARKATTAPAPGVEKQSSHQR